MKVLFHTNKNIQFLEDDKTINVNDFMAHRLMAQVEMAMSHRETLWVQFENENHPTIVSKETMMAKEFVGGEEWYVLLIPEDVINVPGDWQFELYIKRLKLVKNEETNEFEETFERVFASNPGKFTVADGLAELLPKIVTNESIASLYSEAEAAVEMLKGIPEITTDDEGKFLRVVDGKWQASSVPIAENESF